MPTRDFLATKCVRGELQILDTHVHCIVQIELCLANVTNYIICIIKCNLYNFIVSIISQLCDYYLLSIIMINASIMHQYVMLF